MTAREAAGRLAPGQLECPQMPLIVPRARHHRRRREDTAADPGPDMLRLRLRQPHHGGPDRLPPRVVGTNTNRCKTNPRARCWMRSLTESRSALEALPLVPGDPEESFADRSVVNTFATLVVSRWLRSGSALKSCGAASPRIGVRRADRMRRAPSSAPSLVSKDNETRGVSDN